MSSASRALLFPGIFNSDSLHRVGRFQELSKCIQVFTLTDKNPIPSL